jgi:transposase-like protein
MGRNKKLNSDEVKKLYCEQNKNLSEIAKVFNVHMTTIKRYLKNSGVILRSKNHIKGEPSPEDKKEIIRLYSEEHRGSNYISSVFDVSDFYINSWLKKWKVPKVSKSDLAKKNREVYGSTSGFSGKKHSKKSKEQISKSGVEAWSKEDRIPVIGKSRTFNTKVGKVLGSYEVAYLQGLINEEVDLPTPNRKKIKTPHGHYVPDFDYGDKFIEIKSDFTLKVCKGEMPKTDGTYSDEQWKKIQWINENKKSVEIIVLEKNEAFNLFVQAINTKFVLDNVEIHKKQYKIINN